MLWGGRGKDVFVIHPNDLNGRDRIKTFLYDYRDTEGDLIDLSRTPITSYEQLDVYSYGEDQYVNTPTVQTPQIYQWGPYVSPFRIYMDPENHGTIDVSYDDFIYAGTPQQWLTDGDDIATFAWSDEYSVHYGLGGIDTVDLALRATAGVGHLVDLERGRIENGEVHHILEFENVNGSNGKDTIIGNGGANVLNGRNNSDLIDGGAGDDLIDGGHGCDNLIGGAGDDTITGGAGIDRLTGGAGNDTFIIATDGRIDQILDFEHGDHVDLTSWNIDGFEDLTITSSWRETVLVQSGNHVVRIAGETDLGASDFIF